MDTNGLEQRIKDLEARTHGIVNAVLDGVIIIDAHGEIDMFNPGAERIFGISAADATGKNISELMAEPDRDRHAEHMDRYMSGQPPTIIGIGREVVGRRINGETFPMELAVGEVSGADGLHFVGVVRDISERRKIEEALRRSEEGFRLIFANAPIGVLTTDFGGRVNSCNPALLSMLRSVDSDIVGHSVFEFAVPGDEETLAPLFDDMANAVCDVCYAELRWRGGKGATRHVTIHFSVVRLPEAAGFVIGQVVDRTEQVIFEEGANAAREQLAHVGRLTTMGEMASAIAHEINQPLTAIAAHAQACRRIIKQGPAGPEFLANAFEHIADQALRAGEVVKRIRGFVSKRESERSVVTITQVLETVMDLAEADARAAQVKIEVLDRTVVSPVFVDSVQIQQVCLNLIRNGIDAMAVKDPAERIITISRELVGERVMAHFDDRGDGVSETELDQLFHPFFTTKESGMGMGLSISRSIIAAHDGELTYEKNRFGGARFTFSLPIAVK
jgi:two-component system, LuxR family, sensor kinase FixL